MFSVEKLRKFEVKMPDGTWIETTMAQLQSGDIVRMFETNGKQVSNYGQSEFLVTGQPMFVIDGIVEDCEEYAVYCPPK